jgi:hypothetical protein
MSELSFEGDVRTLSPQSQTATHEHTLPRGAEVVSDGSVRFAFGNPQRGPSISKLMALNRHCLWNRLRTGGMNSSQSKQEYGRHA